MKLAAVRIAHTPVARRLHSQRRGCNSKNLDQTHHHARVIPPDPRTTTQRSRSPQPAPRTALLCLV